MSVGGRVDLTRSPAGSVDGVCGRYAVSARPERLADQFDVVDIFDGLPGPDYNVAPTVTVPAVLERTVRQGDDAGQTRRRLAPLTWGLPQERVAVDPFALLLSPEPSPTCQRFRSGRSQSYARPPRC